MISKILHYVEYITLNLASLGWVAVSMPMQEELSDTAEVIEEVQKGFHAPLWVTILVGLSIVFFNIARGIAALKNKAKSE